MTAPDLVRQILAAIEETERLAGATIATVNPAKGRWVVAGEYGTEVRDSRGHLIVKHSWPNEIAHIIHNDPVSVLRRCAADRRMVEAVQRGITGHPGPCVNYIGQDPAAYSEHDSCELHLQWAATTLPLTVLKYLADSYGVAPAAEPPDTQEAPR